MKKIGVTGGIGAGKTTFCSILSQVGHPVISADDLASKALEKNSPCYQEIMKILNYPDSLPSAMTQIFSNTKLKEQIENIMHPYIFQQIQKEEALLEKQKHEIIFYEIPLLFEKNIKHYFHFIVLLTCPEKIRKERLKNRLHLSETDITQRIQNQIPDSEKKKEAHFIIENQGTLDELRDKAKELLQILTKKESNHAPMD